MKAPTTSGNERTRPQGRTEASVPTVPEPTPAVEPSAATTPDPREIAASLSAQSARYLRRRVDRNTAKREPSATTRALVRLGLVDSFGNYVTELGRAVAAILVEGAVTRG